MTAEGCRPDHERIDGRVSETMSTDDHIHERIQNALTTAWEHVNEVYPDYEQGNRVRLMQAYLIAWAIEWATE